MNWYIIFIYLEMLILDMMTNLEYIITRSPSSLMILLTLKQAEELLILRYI